MELCWDVEPVIASSPCVRSSTTGSASVSASVAASDPPAGHPVVPSSAVRPPVLTPSSTCFVLVPTLEMTMLRQNEKKLILSNMSNHPGLAEAKLKTANWWVCSSQLLSTAGPAS